MSTWGRRFCRAFSIKLAIFQRNRRIPRTDLRFLPASSSNHNYKDGNENTEIYEHNKYFERNLNNTFQVVHLFSVSLQSYRTTKGWQIWLQWEWVNRFPISNTVFSSERPILKHQFNLLTRVTKRSGSRANKSTWNLTSRSYYRTWSSRPK